MRKPVRLGFALWLLGLPGVVTVVWALLPPLSAHAELLRWPPWGVLLLGSLQATVLLALAVAVGVWLAPCVGLRAPATSAWVAGQPVVSALRPQLLPGVCGGLVWAGWLWGMSLAQPEALRPKDPASAMPFVVELLYGGITEELLVRWGLMTLLLWLGWRLLQRGRGTPGVGVVALAVLLSAALFALGQLPAAHALAGALTLPMVAFVLVGNTAVGLLAGWLYARQGLEAAMVAHVTAHGLLYLAL